MTGLVALLFIGFGLWALISPKSSIAFKMKLMKALGIKMTIAMTPKALKTFRFIGVGIVILGFLLLFS